MSDKYNEMAEKLRNRYWKNNDLRPQFTEMVSSALRQAAREAFDRCAEIASSNWAEGIGGKHISEAIRKERP